MGKAYVYKIWCDLEDIQYGRPCKVQWDVSVSYHSNLYVFRAKLYNRKRFTEKIQMKKQIKMHEKKEAKNKKEDVVPKGAVPAYLLDR